MKGGGREEGAETCWEESRAGASPGSPEMRWALGCTRKPQCLIARQHPHRALGSWAKSGSPPSGAMTTFSSPS